MIQNDTITKIATGSIGFASTELAPMAVDAVTSSPQGVVQIIVQIIIGIATLVGLFRNKK